MTHIPDSYLTFLNQLSATRNKISIINRPAYKFQTKLHTLSQIISIKESRIKKKASLKKNLNLAGRKHSKLRLVSQLEVLGNPLYLP